MELYLLTDKLVVEKHILCRATLRMRSKEALFLGMSLKFELKDKLKNIN